MKTNKGRPIAACSLPVRPNFCGRDLRHIERFFKTLFERELAPLAAVQVAGLEESRGTFTKS